jgi:hypothetical protein
MALGSAGHDTLDGLPQEVIDRCSRAGVLVGEADEVWIGSGEAKRRVDHDTLGLAVHEADGGRGWRQEAVAGAATRSGSLPRLRADGRPAVFAVVERLGERKLATLDHRHFTVLRPRHVDALDLVPA